MGRPPNKSNMTFADKVSKWFLDQKNFSKVAWAIIVVLAAIFGLDVDGTNMFCDCDKNDDPVVEQPADPVPEFILQSPRELNQTLEF